MTLTISDELKALFDSQLATGRYANTSTEEVLKQALSALAEQQATLDDLEASLTDMDAGRVRPLEDVADEIRRGHGWSAS